VVYPDFESAASECVCRALVVSVFVAVSGLVSDVRVRRAGIWMAEFKGIARRFPAISMGW